MSCQPFIYYAQIDKGHTEYVLDMRHSIMNNCANCAHTSKHESKMREGKKEREGGRKKENTHSSTAMIEMLRMPHPILGFLVHSRGSPQQQQQQMHMK